jgi:hypothetical protein
MYLVHGAAAGESEYRSSKPGVPGRRGSPRDQGSAGPSPVCGIRRAAPGVAIGRGCREASCTIEVCRVRDRGATGPGIPWRISAAPATPCGHMWLWRRALTGPSSAWCAGTARVSTTTGGSIRSRSPRRRGRGRQSARRARAAGARIETVKIEGGLPAVPPAQHRDRRVQCVRVRRSPAERGRSRSFRSAKGDIRSCPMTRPRVSRSTWR